MGGIKPMAMLTAQNSHHDILDPRNILFQKSEGAENSTGLGLYSITISGQNSTNKLNLTKNIEKQIRNKKV